MKFMAASGRPDALWLWIKSVNRVFALTLTFMWTIPSTGHYTPHLSWCWSIPIQAAINLSN